MNDASGSMFVPDDEHRKRVADAVREAGSTGTVTVTLTPDEADNLHTMAVNHYRQVREDLDQPTRNMVLAVLQVIEEATKAAFAKQSAQSLRNWRSADRVSRVLVDNLDLHVNAMQAAELIGVLSAVELPGISDGHVVDGVVKRLNTLRPTTDLGRQAQYRAVAKRLLTTYREVQAEEVNA